MDQMLHALPNLHSKDKTDIFKHMNIINVDINLYTRRGILDIIPMPICAHTQYIYLDKTRQFYVLVLLYIEQYSKYICKSYKQYIS